MLVSSSAANAIREKVFRFFLRIQSFRMQILSIFAL